MKNVEEMSLEELAEFQEKNRQKMEQQRENLRKRKNRTHKLIVIGAECAPLISGFEEMTDEDLRSTVQMLLF